MLEVLLLSMYMLGGVLMDQSLTVEAPYRLLQVLGWPLVVTYQIVRSKVVVDR